VLVSWALPKGLPTDPRANHLAIRSEDHPLDYATFEGEIPPGGYGAGRIDMWDRGSYECEKWTGREIKVVLHGHRAQGRYVLIHTDGTSTVGGATGAPGSGREWGANADAGATDVGHAR
jgi:bifunctional non-homologous end joining protein LigD